MLIVDQSGKAADYFKYSAALFELHGYCKKEIIKKEITKQDVSEEFRKEIVNFMRSG